MRFEAHWGSTVIELSFSREKKGHLGSKPKMAKKLPKNMFLYFLTKSQICLEMDQNENNTQKLHVWE